MDWMDLLYRRLSITSMQLRQWRGSHLDHTPKLSLGLSVSTVLPPEQWDPVLIAGLLVTAKQMTHNGSLNNQLCCSALTDSWPRRNTARPKLNRSNTDGVSRDIMEWWTDDIALLLAFHVDFTKTPCFRTFQKETTMIHGRDILPNPY